MVTQFERFKFERVQWPVGHGGFHSGRFKGGGADFRYFFDCGAWSKDGKNLIRAKLAITEFDFGVISHFDHDHYSELGKVKKVKVLFLPYMTPEDMVLQALADQAANTLPVAQAFQGFQVLRQLQDNGTQIVMVNGDGEVRSDESDELLPGELPLAGGLSWRIPSFRNGANDPREMPHEATVEVLKNSTELLYFKFFNHRKEEASKEFAKQLAEAVEAKKLKNLDKVPYTSVDDFLKDIAKDSAELASINGRAMQKIYKSTLAAPALKAARITASNLSSLTMFSRSCWEWHYPRTGVLLRTQGSRSKMRGDDNGWMLTGDLELTPETWPAFNDHYFYELSECVAFNVPHHASAISLCEEAVAFLSDQFFVSPVNAEDSKHPASELTERLKRHGSSQHSVTGAWESTVAIESLWRIRC